MNSKQKKQRYVCVLFVFIYLFIALFERKILSFTNVISNPHVVSVGLVLTFLRVIDETSCLLILIILLSRDPEFNVGVGGND